MNKFKFNFLHNFKEITKVSVNFELRNDNENSLIIITGADIKIEKPIYYDSHNEYFDIFVQRYLEKKNDEMLKIATEHYLKEYREDGFVEMNRGHVQTGKHIVKCIYDLNFESESISYKRYNELQELVDKELIGEENEKNN